MVSGKFDHYEGFFDGDLDDYERQQDIGMGNSEVLPVGGWGDGEESIYTDGDYTDYDDDIDHLEREKSQIPKKEKNIGQAALGQMKPRTDTPQDTTVESIKETERV